MCLKLETGGVMFWRCDVQCCSRYTPQVGCELEEKEKFWSEMDEVIESVPRNERMLTSMCTLEKATEVMRK